MTDSKTQRELIDTIMLANQIVDFYEQVMGQQTEEIESLTKEKSQLRKQLHEARSLLKLALQNPVHPVN